MHLLIFLRKNKFLIVLLLIFIFIFILKRSWVDLREIDLNKYTSLEDSELIAHVDNCRIDIDGNLKLSGWAFLRSNPYKGRIILVIRNKESKKINYLIPTLHVQRNDVFNHFSIPIDPLAINLIGFESAAEIKKIGDFEVDVIAIEGGFMRAFKDACAK